MKLLKSKDFLLGKGNCCIELFIDNIDGYGNKKEIKYLFKLKISKSSNLKDGYIFKNLLDNLTEMFNSLDSNKFAVYVPSSSAI